FGRGWQALAITRSLGRQGIEVFCGEEAAFAPCSFSKYCTGSFRYPSVSENPEGFLDFMEEKIKELKPADSNEPYVLIPVHKETWLFAKHRQRFEPHIKMALTSYENMALTHNKGRLPGLARELGVRIPETFQYQSLEEMDEASGKLDYPVFLKMREGASGVGLEKVGSTAQLQASFREFVKGYELEPVDYPLVQQFVEGDDYCVTVLFQEGRCVGKMTYRNIRAFPRVTGAGSLRETVKLEEAEAEAVRLLEHLNWHGIAELDFRKTETGPSYLIEINPRFFGGLPQALAANVDYPFLYFQVAAGQTINATPEVDYDKRTETPITGLLATLEEIARDDVLLDRFRTVRKELGQTVHSDVRTAKIRPLLKTLKEAANPKDLKGYLAKQFENHQGTINDVLTRDDPLPALGALYPVVMMLKHGKLSMGVLTSEAEVSEQKPRRRLRDLIRRPTWRVIWVCALLYTLSIFLQNWAPTRDNLGWVLALPTKLGETLFGDVINPSTLFGAVKQTAYNILDLIFLFIAATLLVRQSRTKHGGD
ncbi:MAG: ATP-grasp domain-containing protein, partial [Deltaproteobacteria bacterium]|nr:ATP-grasp domain-containing protein [Deltaproteobacteria bacterium]